MEKKRVVLIVKGKDLSFDVTLEAYNKYLNEVTNTNKIGPAKNFLMRTVAEESKEDVRALLAMPSAAIQVASAVLEEYTPDIEIVVGK